MTAPTAHRSVLWLAALLAAAVPARAGQGAPDAAATAGIVVRDLDYGDVLFHEFADDPFGALVRLEAARDLDRIPHHEAEAELLAGGLYLSLGLHAEAARIFDRLLAGPVPAPVADRALYYLARIGYQHGYVDQAWRQLQRIQGALPGEFEGDRRLLESNVLMAQGRFAEAAARLRAWTDTSDAAAYARFNLGVALQRNGQPAEGRRWLESVGTMPAASEEQLSLRDRANLALGYAALQARDPGAAMQALQRVRLDGPFTSMALLGLGWAESDAGKFDRALVAWLALRDRPLLDATVQESMLAVPYAYTKLGANAQAAEQYRKAIEAYGAENARLDESIAAIRAGGFLGSVLKAVPPSADMSAFWQLQKLPDAPHTRYLYRLMAAHEFQAGLQNYRDLDFMRRDLERWRDSLGAFAQAAAARGTVQLDAATRSRERLAGVDLDSLQRRHDELDARLAAVAAAAPGDADAARAAVLRTELLDVATALVSARGSASALQQAGAMAPQAAPATAARVQQLTGRVDSALPRLDAAADATERVLANLAIAELEAQKRRLASYTAQAQFGLAALYDAAASGGGK